MSEKLKTELKELQTELKQIDSEDPRLKKLASDVDSALEQTGDAAQDLIHSFQHVAEEFEVQHPKVASLLSNVMTQLSNIGI